MTLFDKLLGGGFLAGKKTYIAALLYILTGCAAYLTGESTLAEFIASLSEGTAIAALRAGISKAGGS